MIHLKSKRELQTMREAGRHVGEILLAMRELARPGVSTAEIDRATRLEISSGWGEIFFCTHFNLEFFRSNF